MGRRQLDNVLDRERVVSLHQRILPQLSHIPGEVVDEGVVVVDE
jgi:hypothetical protein